MISIPVGQAVLQKVAAKLGGLQAAAVRLGVPTPLLTFYVDGTAPVPDVLLLRAVDVMLDEVPHVLPRRSPHLISPN